MSTASAYLHLGGLFVSFMSGNSTRMGVSLAEGNWWGAAAALGLIALFVIGAAAGSLIVLGRGANRQPWVLLAEAGAAGARRALLSHSVCRMSPSPRSCWRWAWRTRCSRSMAAPVSASLTSPARWSRSGRLVGEGADRRRALGLGAEPAAVGGAGDGFGVRRTRLSLDQSRRDLVCRGRGAGHERDRGRDDAPMTALTANAACPN